MYILGISAFYHDSAACLIKDGHIIAAVQEERFTRIKHDSAFPNQAIKYCLEEADILINEVGYIGFYDDPKLKFDRIVKTHLSYAPFSYETFKKSIPIWLGEKLWIKDIIKDKLNYYGEIITSEHHMSHAASAFFPSPFIESAVLTMDGVGEWATTSCAFGQDNNINIFSDIRFPNSLGLLYSAFTDYTGFRVNSGEYKIMGLAPYGKPIYKKLIYDNLIDVKDDGSFKMNMEFFNYGVGTKMTNSKFHKLFGGPPRKPESDLSNKEMDLARSIQEVTEEVVLKMAKYAKKETKSNYLCMAGGVALNCVSNGKLLRSGIFNDIWIQPAAGDAGGALGCALNIWYQELCNKRVVKGGNDFMNGSFLGPQFKQNKIKKYLDDNKYTYKKINTDSIPEIVADLINEQNVIGWFQGRMEFGPRALGSRTIIGDARSSEKEKLINLKIKYRESFRPFAPSVRAENISDYFQIDRESPYMLFVADVNEDRQVKMTNPQSNLFGLDMLNVIRSDIPAVTHVDYSARIQSVNKKTNELYHRLLTIFNEKYGCPVIVNTSFNVRGEPIVCTPEDAFICFMRTEMDYLIMGNFLLSKKDQEPLKNNINWQKEFKLD